MIKRLIDIFGKDYYYGDADLLSYGVDASQLEGNAVAVVFPSSVDQIRQLLRFAARTDYDVVVRGAGTGLAGAVVPQNSIIVDMSKFNKILRINVKDKTCEVQTGVVVDYLNSQLEKYNLFFPVIPSSHSVCTLGGMISCNASGLRALKFGSTADWVQELEVVDGSGKLYNVKEGKILDFVGTEGTIGIVTKAKLKLADPLNAFSLSLFNFNHSQDLVDKAKSLMLNPHLIALEFFDKTAAQVIGKDEQFTLIAEFDNEDGEITDFRKIRQLWEERESLYPNLSQHGYVFIEDPQVDADKIPSLLRWLRSNKIPCFGHVGTGIIHPCFRHNQKNMIVELYKFIEQINGKVSGEHGYGLLKKAFTPADWKNRLQSLKKIYDAENTLNNGKVL